ncbi:circularly permuted type 2 ATP-grasp protein [Arcticibacterium luteifluviistationis]|uniref:Circularly permuted ATP-grasp type 2 domain-containing protein n=1 Tax=Arcticibacterium luteifluviistationis TaxID=1784714 RepID=A0A2Z4GG51_9BACT|nr:circularly permuted type 2 ATP-grasp protein [Arcticibacterium luteifluviistationis]AWW00026.1 hypothetical protein DJ013_18370 [Arcticibacterium luteifluviistationis]
MIDSYIPDSDVYDEMFESDGKVRKHYEILSNHFDNYDITTFAKLAKEAKEIFFNKGITFAVYSETMQATERIFPFDLVPRLITSSKWDKLEAGILQRNLAINLFLKDVYNEQRIFNEKVVPRELIESSVNFLKEMKGFVPPGGVYNHINGSDIIRHSDGEYYVLEDNARCPSGVSYVYANRTTLKETFPQLFSANETRQVNDYPSHLLEMLQSVTPEGLDCEPRCVVLTPGVFNSAYYEHAWLAQSMGIELVEGRDLYVESDKVFTRTINGPAQVHVIYRRVDDAFLDPEVFRKDSVLGVKGLMRAYRAGNVNIVNAPGTGVADDKAVYTYMPEIIKFYLGEEAKLKNVPTYRCELDDDYKFVMGNIPKLVIKPVDESGGYGISIGNTLSAEEISEVQKTISANRRKYIAQPIMSLSMAPTFIEETKTIEPRYLDLRTFCLLGKDSSYVLPGGLTRVALKKGNLIVNSSQGGGSKDTWVIK